MSGDILFSVTKKDLRIEFFRAGGKGGQKQNKTSSACRITHAPSGAVGESRNHRNQSANKKAALERLVASKKFRTWLRVEASARLQGYADVKRKIEEMMRPENLRIEVVDTEGG